MKIACLLFFSVALHAQVQVESLPEQGIQPQVAVTAAGVVHLVYLQGEPKGCDIHYAMRSAAGGEWSAPIKVNSVPHSAIAAGTIRGAQIALGKAGSVQVIWNGSGGSKTTQAPLLYAHLLPDDTSFSEQQNLMGDTTALDGGASIAANDSGHICVVWHGAPVGKQGEQNRMVWLRRSVDDGRTFAAAEALNVEQPGVCACCSLRAQMTADDTLSVLYRAATTPEARGMTLLISKSGQTKLRKLDDWKTVMCPMSSASLLPLEKALFGAWENDGRIVTGILSSGDDWRKIGPPNAKHPVLAYNTKEQTLIASVIGSGWAKAGRLHWDVLDAQGKVIESGEGEKLPVWSYAAVYAQPSGGFVVLR